MNPQANIALRRSRQTLLLLAALFFVPFIAAWVIYSFFPDWRPTGQTNYGDLIAPAQPVPALVLKDSEGKPLDLLKDKWSLVYLGSETCDAGCIERITLVRQIRLALGKNLSRLQRIYIAPDDAAEAAAVSTLAKDQPGMQIVVDGGANGQRATDFFKSADPQAFYLVDPNGNWLLVYTGRIDPKRLLEDLKKLMRLSSIG
jgi:cytochrome oxidase Cu insertion factor (SCO1/SenC/PrrC family)